MSFIYNKEQTHFQKLKRSRLQKFCRLSWIWGIFSFQNLYNRLKSNTNKSNILSATICIECSSERKRYKYLKVIHIENDSTDFCHNPCNVWNHSFRDSRDLIATTETLSDPLISSTVRIQSLAMNNFAKHNSQNVQHCRKSLSTVCSCFYNFCNQKATCPLFPHKAAGTKDKKEEMQPSLVSFIIFVEDNNIYQHAMLNTEKCGF